MLPEAITGKTSKIGIKSIACTFFAFQRKIAIMLFSGMFASKLGNFYLHGGLQVFTLKSFLLTNQYIPHSSGLVGTNINFLQAHYLQAVLNFLPKYESLCPAMLWPQKHLECFPNREHYDFFCSFQYVI